MGKKTKAAQLSIFMGLASNTRRAIRQQAPLPPSAEAPKPVEPEIKASDLLPTQPPREDEEDDGPSSSGVNGSATGETVEAGPSSLVDVGGVTSSMSAVSDLTRTVSQPSPPEALASNLVSVSTVPYSVGTALKRVRSPEETLTSKRRKTKGKGRATDIENDYEGHPWDCTGLVPRYNNAGEVPQHLRKYFHQRHSLFPAYSRLPLLMDDTGWFSVTPAVIADHIAERCRSDVVLDAFCGVGGNAIAFAKTCERVIAMDNDPTRLRLARHNALHHGVADRIEFILADYTSWAAEYVRRGAHEREQVDVVFLSPPWGGPEYLSFGDGESRAYPLSAVLPIPGDELFKLTGPITPNIAYFLPRNVDVAGVSNLAAELGMPLYDAEGGRVRSREWVEIEEQWVGDKLKAVTAYFGALAGGE